MSQASKTIASDDYEAQDDLRTLTRADDIRNDSARMKRVAKHHRKATRSLKAAGRVLTGGGRK